MGTEPDGATVVLGRPAIVWARDGRIARSRFCLGPVTAPVPTDDCPPGEGGPVRAVPAPCSDERIETTWGRAAGNCPVDRDVGHGL